MDEKKPTFSSVYGEIAMANVLHNAVFLNVDQAAVLYQELSRLLDLENSLRRVLESVLSNDPK